MTGPDGAERVAQRVHVALLVLLAAGVAIWLWRVYGFEPLRIVEPKP